MKNNLILTNKFILPVILIMTILFILNHFIFVPIQKAENYLQKGAYTVGEVFSHKIIDNSESKCSEIEFKCLANDRYYIQKYSQKLENITRGETFLATFINEDFSNTLRLLYYRPVNQEDIKTSKNWKVTQQDAEYASPVKIGDGVSCIIICLIAYCITYLAIKYNIRILKLREEGIPTVGTVIARGQKIEIESGLKVTYTFKIDEEQYIGTASADQNVQIGQCFSVFYDPKNPDNNTILLDAPLCVKS